MPDGYNLSALVYVARVVVDEVKRKPIKSKLELWSYVIMMNRSAESRDYDSKNMHV